MRYETRPGGEAATRANTRSKAKTRKEAVLAEATEDGAEVEERGGKVRVTRRKKKVKK